LSNYGQCHPQEEHKYRTKKQKAKRLKEIKGIKQD